MNANELMARKSEPGPATDDEGSESPFTVEFFMVKGLNFTCMAYRDHYGRWRRAFGDEALPGHIQIFG